MLADGNCCYVYGVIKGGVCNPALSGIDPAYPVCALPYGNIQAVVSEVALDEFGQDALESNLRDIAWLESKVRAHEDILETIMADHTLIPMRFCTIFRGENRVLEMLLEHYESFTNTFGRLEGRKEWGIKVYADAATLSERVGEVSDRVRKLETEMASKSPGAAYIWKKRLDEAIAEEIERVGDECVQRSHDRLSFRSDEQTTCPLQGREITGLNEEMVLNGAYLVVEEQLNTFEAEFNALREEYGRLGFSFQLHGPWPPYNFV